ncbi:hypothetical protein [Rhodococcus sovatensis]|uniref:Uncharacterized protein n=1 Tax=Rhodococcus sovatensis TaxID=1805840 RepID=A0ABZ2PJF8_9NOCA
MDDLPPMRPVSVPPDEPRSTAPWWKVALAFVAVVALGATTATRNGSWWIIALAVVMVVGGAVLCVQSTARILAENRGRRIPWFGSPAVRPRALDFKLGLGAPAVMFGAGSLGNNTALYWPITTIVAGVLFVGSSWAAFALHNRRVTAISDA